MEYAQLFPSGVKAPAFSDRSGTAEVVPFAKPFTRGMSF
jgi:hypothetical protein